MHTANLDHTHPQLFPLTPHNLTHSPLTSINVLVLRKKNYNLLNSISASCVCMRLKLLPARYHTPKNMSSFIATITYE